jgi:putative DNA methylase
LKPALKLLQQGNIAPVDFAQAAIGPGIAIYSRYDAVLNSDNSPVSIREALAEISATIDEVQNEQDSELDNETRFLIAWFEQFGYEMGDFGDAETLSRAKNTVIDTISNAGLLYAKASKVRIIKRDEYDYEKFDHRHLTIWEVCQRLVYYLDKHSENGAAELMSKLDNQTVNIARDLTYRLFKLCELKKHTNEAILFNSLIVSWSEIDRLVKQKKNNEKQLNMFDQLAKLT